MTFVPDHVIEHLRREIERPDFRGTRYELLDEIGRGGMGVVYRCRDSVLDREVAIKILDAGLPAHSASEERLLAGLEHPGIVPVYDAGELADGRRFFAMRLVRGRRLDEFVASESSLPSRIRVFLKICETIEFAHRRGVTHGDLKPQNIMTGELGQVFVLDWGIARVGSLAGATVQAGTPRYMAPESSATSLHLRDIFSLGRVLDDILRDRRPAPLAAIADRASSTDPAARYASVEDLTADIERFLDRLPVSAYRESARERMIRFASRNQALLLLLSAYFLVRLAIFLFRL